MYYTYVLWSKEDGKFYVGYTADLLRRLKEHQGGHCHATLRMSNPRFIVSETESFQYGHEIVRLAPILYFVKDLSLR